MKVDCLVVILAVILCAHLAFVACDGGDDDDDVSGDLTWQNPPSDECMTWGEALEYCEKLSFDGHGDWRLPTISELRSLIRGCDATETGGSCGVTDNCLYSYCQDSSCYECSFGEGPAGGCYWPSQLNGDCDWYYWSSSAVADYGSLAWCVHFGFGYVSNDVKGSYNFGVRCVR